MENEALVALPGEQALKEDQPLWLASWANPHRKMEWIHRYLFAAPTQDAAEEKVDAWIRKRSTPLPRHIEMRQRRLVLRELPEFPLDFWEIAWLEDDEEHTLVVFELKERHEAYWYAAEWARTRRESWEQLQLLRLLTAEESRQFRMLATGA
jgi:hypothetical protein